MSTNTTSKSFTTAIAAFLIAVATMTATQDAKAYTIESPWAGKAKIRPGQMSGDLKTDKFIDYFIPFGGNSDSLFFLDLRGRTDDIDTDEFNIGLGYRSLFGADKYIFGINAFYDVKKTAIGNKFRQGGLGVEVLTKHFDGRINYYEPTGSSSKRLYENDIYSFGSSELFISYGYEEALKGMDFEAGFLVPFISNIMETRIYGGIYDFNSDIDTNKNKEGTKYRLELRPSNLLTINFEHYDGKDSETNDIAGAYLNLPFSLERLISGDNPFSPVNEKFTFFKGTRKLRDRMTDMVVRDRDIVTAAYTEDTLRHVKDIIYVNGDVVGGSGTLSDPYESLDLAITDSLWGDNTIIYITSNDAIADTYINNITLSSGMELWSSSYLHPIYNLGGTGAGTIIDGSGGTIITLADDNSIIGLTLSNGDYGIYGQGTYDINPATDSSIYTTLIEGNTITGMSTIGIYIENLYNGSDDLNNLTYDLTLSDNTLDTNNLLGAYINYFFNTTGSADAITVSHNISNNSFNNNDDGLLIDTYLYTGDSATNINITNNIDGNSATGNSNSGMYINNYIDAYATYVSSIVSSNTINVSGSIVNSFTNNTTTGNGTDGIIIDYNSMSASLVSSGATIDEDIFVNNSGVITNYFYGNDASSNGLNGLVIVGSGLYSSGDFDNSAITGTVTIATEGSIVNYFEGNISDSNGENGFVSYSNFTIEGRADLYGGSTITGDLNVSTENTIIKNTFINNSTDLNSLSGINLAGNSIFAEGLVRQGSTATGNISSTTSGSSITNTFTGNSASINTDDGIHIGLNSINSTAAADNGNITGTLTASNSNSKIENAFESNITNTNDYGVQIETNYIYSYVDATNTSAVTGDITAAINSSAIVNTFTGNESSYNNNAGIIIGDNNIYGNATIDSSIITTTNGAGGNLSGVAELSSITNSFSSNITDLNGAGGIEISSNTIASNTDIGVSATVEGDTNSSVQSSAITNNLSLNNALSNSGDGIILRDNQLRTYHTEDVTSSITGSINTDVTATTITFNISNNSILTNLNDGLYIATIAVPSLTGSTTIDVNATGNEIENNGRYGVFIGHVGSAIYDGDLNTNSFANNTTFDLNNQTGETITATDNWWGADTDPGIAGFINGDPVNYTPWRSAK